MDKVIIYTDGACSGNPGPGGWAAVLIYNGHEKEISGAQKDTTNNVMEITAVVEGLKRLKYPCEVVIFSDSAYVVNCFEKGWIEKWTKNDWVSANGEPVKNRELLEELYKLTQIHIVEFNKVKGHSTVKYNNRCDQLARKAIKSLH